ncbi:MAG: radical SAM protein [Candidatus Hydrogenedentes bacterium]|nr:radical SAM protein [Candidatus Hydrogenedentota bacterium]
MLRNGGHQIFILDCANPRRSIAGLLRGVRDFHPDAIIWSIGNPTAGEDLQLAEVLRAAAPGARTLVFGTVAATLADYVLDRVPAIDAIALAEPEGVALEALSRWSEGEELSGVPGLRHRNGGDSAAGERRPFLSLSSLPMPAWDLVGPRNYKLPLSGRPFLMAAPSRGCPYRCTFCTTETYYGTKVRERTVHDFVDELSYSVHTYGVRDFLYWADTFTIDRRFVLALCAEIQGRKLGIQWACNSRTDTMDEEMALAMRAAGCWIVSFGIESASREILDSSRKRARTDTIHATLRMADDTGLACAGHFIIGMPGETRATALATIEYACSLPLSFAQFYAAAPWPGAPLFDEALKMGRVTLEDVWAGIGQDEARVSVCALEPGEINELIALAYRRFYRRRKPVFAAVRQLRPAGLAQLLPVG